MAKFHSYQKGSGLHETFEDGNPPISAQAYWRRGRARFQGRNIAAYRGPARISHSFLDGRLSENPMLLTPVPETSNSTSTRDITITELPDEAICQIFGALSGRCGISGSLCRDSMALSQVCKRLNYVYRFLFVRSVRCGLRNFRPRDIQRLLLRFPSSSQLTIEGNNSQEALLFNILTPGTRGTESGARRLEALSIFSCTLSQSHIQAIPAHCPFLQKLCLPFCEGVTDGGLRTVFQILGPHLREVSLRDTFPRSPELTDEGLTSLGNLHILAHLDISGIPNFSKTFNSLAGLKNLRHLVMSHAKVETEALQVALSGLRQLVSLNMSHTPNLTPEVLVSLPKSLSTLNATWSAAIVDDTPSHLLNGLQNLKHLTILLSKHGNLSSLAPILTVAPFLVSLDVSQSHLGSDWDAGAFEKMENLEVLLMSGCDIPEWPLRLAKSLCSIKSLTLSGARGMGMEQEMEHLSHMKGLKNLDLCGCANVGNSTAVAISSLPNLETLSMKATMVDERGVRAIYSGVCKNTLRLFKTHEIPKKDAGRSRRLACPRRHGRYYPVA